MLASRDFRPQIPPLRCISCLPGLFSFSGQICQDCPRGFFSKSEASRECERCAAGLTSSKGGRECFAVGVNQSLPIPNFGPTAFERGSLLVQWSSNGARFELQWSLALNFNPIEGTSVTGMPKAKKKWNPALGTLFFRVRVASSTGDVGEWSSPTRQWTTAQDCTGEEYLHTRVENVEEFACKACPDGADCAGPVSSSTLKSRSGYWRASFDNEDFEKCVYANDCPGNATLPTANTSVSSQCREGHSGILCAVCRANHVRDAAQTIHAYRVPKVRMGDRLCSRRSRCSRSSYSSFRSTPLAER